MSLGYRVVMCCLAMACASFRLPSPVLPRRGPSGGGGRVGLARQGKPLSPPAGRLQKRVCSRREAAEQTRGLSKYHAPGGRSCRGGDTQGRADARSEAPAPAPHLPRHVAAFGGKRLGCSSLRLRVYRLGSVRGLPRGTDRRDSGAQMLNGIGFGMQENKI